MLGAKAEKKDAQELKDFLLKNRLMDFSKISKKTQKHIIFPVIKHFESKKFEIVQEEFKEKNRQKNWIEEVEEKLDEEELTYLKTAHDVVGDIAIIEVPEELKHKEEIIATALLEKNPHIHTVLKKAGEHSGRFRTQKMKYLAGEDKRVALHKENGVEIEVNVEETFFSARLATERKRIMQEVQEGENILVMFSGAGPYTCTLSKNTPAASVTGIELNPVGHASAQRNIIKNKLTNARAINGDVKEVLPQLYSYILGTKSNIGKEAMDARLEKKPRIHEFFLKGNDIDNPEAIKDSVSYVREKGVKTVVMHMPHWYGDVSLYADQETPKTVELLRRFLRIVQETETSAVIHPFDTHNQLEKSNENAIRNLSVLREEFFELFEKNIYFENLTGEYFSDKNHINYIARKTGMKNMCIDVAHHYHRFKDNDRLLKFIKDMKSRYNTYFHLNDSDSKGGEGMRIGYGEIDFERVYPFVNKGVVEVVSKDESTGAEMLESYDKVTEIKPVFDRILMPLPKSAEDFLEEAFSVAKTGTIIHFYDFLHEDEFEKCEEKVKEACKQAGIKYEKLDFVKCGQYSPGKFRVCLDVKITKKRN